MTDGTNENETKSTDQQGMFDFLPQGENSGRPVAEPLVDLLRAAKEERQSKKALKEATTFGDLVSAVQTTGTIGKLQIVTSNASTSTDSEFRIPEGARERWESLGIESGRWHLFGHAKSAEHLSALEQTALEQQHAQEVLSLYSPTTNALLRLTDAGVAVVVAILLAGLFLWARRRRKA